MKLRYLAALAPSLWLLLVQAPDATMLHPGADHPWPEAPPAFAGRPLRRDTDWRLDSLDRAVRREMARRRIVGLSLAVVDSGRIVLERGYGLRDRSSGQPVETSTRFLAGSVSKAVAAAGFLRLAEQQVVALDRSVNEQLGAWQLPDSAAGGSAPVTPRMLLSHMGGVSTHGFPGYLVGKPLPMLAQVLDGTPPANSPPVRRVQPPYSEWRYSGGGYTLLQLLMEETAKQPFAELARRLVLEPTGMSASTFVQPLPDSLRSAAASGYLTNGAAVPSGARIYPEQAAAGLWTTAGDLARFLIAIQQSANGATNAPFSRDLAWKMLTYDRNDVTGLGLFLRGNGARLEFRHDGRDEGFDALMVGTRSSEQGVVILMNSNDDSAAIERIARLVQRLWGWPAHRNVRSVVPAIAAADAAVVRRTRGHYEVRPGQIATYVSEGRSLLRVSDGRPDDEFVATAPDIWQRLDGEVQLRFHRDAQGGIASVDITDDQGTRRGLRRIGALHSDMRHVPDPMPRRTVGVIRVLEALSRGDTAARDGMLPKAWEDFGGRPLRSLQRASDLRFHAAVDISAQRIVRYGAPVHTLLYLRTAREDTPLVLLVYLTSDGTLADFDRVAP